MNHKTVLITGISGFIAKHCAIELLRHGYSVRGTVRSASKAEEVKTTLSKHCDIARLEFVQANLMSEAGWANAMQGLHGVLHIASPFPLIEPTDPQLSLPRQARTYSHAWAYGHQTW